MVLNGNNGGFFLDLDSSDAKPVTLDLGPDKEPEETTPEAPSSPMTLTVSKAEDSASTADVPAVPETTATSAGVRPPSVIQSAMAFTPKETRESQHLRFSLNLA